LKITDYFLLILDSDLHTKFTEILSTEQLVTVSIKNTKVSSVIY
jgi:hypothetical protein